MTVASFQMFSEALGTPQSVNVILPPPERIAEASILYLLHGLLDDQTTWLHRTRLLEHAQQYNLVVVMPFGQRSFYTDQKTGYAWRTWVAKELPEKMETWLNLRGVGSRRHIAGLSMGGYGAMKLGLSEPQRFQSIGAFSGVLDLAGAAQRSERSDAIVPDLIASFGSPEAIAGSGDDVLALPLSVDGPRLFVTCGLEDSLLEGNRRFRDRVHQAEVPLVYEEMPGGHEWWLWDLNVEAYLAWLAELGLLTRLDP
ncbi:alpha/beta hydrolase [Reinekea blandensis]|uniref:Tributyrin esterase n=1 Tax=Reinekea blandensis MED297 TaxID=314283 RepID=A4BBD3_9GAMM|nr:alpha/beta hydrolase family protein [Reinekea blandensis]EAR10746.1 tributyrin esterase [Reinekea sp. MED297] [Reinekea blandensis MED297]